MRKAVWEILNRLAYRRLSAKKWLITLGFMLIIGLESVILVLSCLFWLVLESLS